MTPQERNVMKLALEAYIKAGIGNSTDFVLQGEAYDLAVEALAQPELCKYGQERKSCTSNPMDCQCVLDAALAQPSDSVETPIDFELAYGEIYKNQRAALAKSLAQPEQEPVANWQKRHPDETGGMWVDTNAADAAWWAAQKFEHGWEVREFYTAPPQRKPLTDEKAQEILQAEHCWLSNGTALRIVRAIEAAHGIIKG